ncbi:beta-propeller fold lactonase family protein [Myxosarcina sp. GI1(2024)]
MALQIDDTATIQTNNGQIVIANRGSGNISILDSQTGEELRTVDLPFGEGEKTPEPMYVYHLLSTDEIIVGDRANNRVVFFDQTTYEVTRTVETGAGNFHMWVDPQEKHLWVVNDLDVALTVVELETNETTKVQLPEAAIGTNSIPHDVILDPSGLYAYVTVIREDNVDSDLLIKIDTQTSEILDTVEVGKDLHLSLAPESNLLYVPTQNSNRIDVFDRRGTELVKVDSIEQPGVHGIDFGLDGRYLYTTNLPGGGSNGLFAIDTRTNEIVGDLDGVDTPFSTPHNVWLTGDGQRLFITHSGSEASQVSFYSLDDPTRPMLLDSVDVNGLNPFGLAFAAPIQDDLIVGDNDNDRLRADNGNDRIFGEDGDDLLRGNRGNDKLFGREGDDRLSGGYDNDVLIAGEGSDRLKGGHGNDILIGVSVESLTPGKGEYDVFKGGKGSDTFVLGDALEVYYDDGIAQTVGLKDMALIRDFDLDEADVIRLHGSAEDYRLEEIEGFSLGTAIFYTAEGQAPELVSFVRGVSDLDLSGNAFEFAVSV